jgi:hypothetical protein
LADVPTGPNSTYDRLGQFSGTRLSLPEGAPLGTSSSPPAATIGGGRLLSFYEALPVVTESFIGQPTFAAAAASIVEIVMLDAEQDLCPHCRRPL